MLNDTINEQDMEMEQGSASTYLTFDLGEQTLGVEVRHVREILDMQRITPLPNAPMDVLGVVDVRGVSIPVVDLKTRLGISSIERGEEARIVVIEIASGSQCKPLGILADRVRNVDQIAGDEIEPCPSIGGGHWDSSILQGLSRRGEDLIVLVRLDRIFGDAADMPDMHEADYAF